VNSSQGGGSKDTWIVGGSAPTAGEYGPGKVPELVADQATVTAAIPIIYDPQTEPAHSPRDPVRGNREQQEQQQQTGGDGGC